VGDLKLSGNLNLQGTLTLNDRVLIDGTPALVQLSAPSDPPHASGAPPVVIPPPPASPADPGPTVWVINSFNQTVKAGNKPLVTQGMAMQGATPTWPGMVLPSTGNPASGVKVNMIPINVEGDKAIIFPSGASVALSTSGQ
jgi:hypothetical protein